MEDMETLTPYLSLTSNGLLDFLLLLYLELMSLIGGVGPGAVCPRGERREGKGGGTCSEGYEEWLVIHAHNRNLLLGVCVCL